MSAPPEDDTPKDRPPAIVERTRHHTPVTLEIVNRRITEHSEEDARALGAISAEIAEVRREQATKSQTKSQTKILAIVTVIATAIGTILHSLLGL